MVVPYHCHGNPGKPQAACAHAAVNAPFVAGDGLTQAMGMLDVPIAVRIDLYSAMRLARTDVNESHVCLIRAVDTIDHAVRDIRQFVGLTGTVNPDANDAIRPRVE